MHPSAFLSAARFPAAVPAAPCEYPAGELYDDRISDDVKAVQFAMHVGKRLRISLDGATELVWPAIGNANRLIRERPIFGERVNPSGNGLFPRRPGTLCELLLHLRSLVNTPFSQVPIRLALLVSS